jgi:hypothetical protein
MRAFREEIASSRYWDVDKIQAELQKTAAEYKRQEKLAHKSKK